jgi:hypothetical protein
MYRFGSSYFLIEHSNTHSLVFGHSDGDTPLVEIERIEKDSALLSWSMVVSRILVYEQSTSR